MTLASFVFGQLFVMKIFNVYGWLTHLFSIPIFVALVDNFNVYYNFEVRPSVTKQVKLTIKRKHN